MQNNSNTPFFIRPAGVWDANKHAPRSGIAVLVAGNRIAAVGPEHEIDIPGDATHIDLPGATLLPGLIDAHSHLFLHPYNETSWDDQVLKESETYRTLRAVRHAEATLRAGFTTLRDLGTEGAGFADVALKRAIAEGLVPGPRLFVATRAIVATGSYGPAARNYRPDCCLPQGAEEASGVDEVVKAVRHQASHGADWIKLYGDYRTGPHGEVQPTFSQEELHAAVGAAHDLGRPVAVHAMIDEAMRRAVMAGVDTIEHGYGGSEKTFALMAEKGVAFLPTLTAPEAIGEYFHGHEHGGDPTESMALAAQGFRRALAQGVTIGCGSDVGVFAHGTSHRELHWMTKLGMSPAQALDAATGTNARILRAGTELGQVREDFLADLIAVRGNPLQDIAAVRDVCFVMKNGTVIREG